MYFAMLNGGEVLVIIVAILVLFGGSRLPQLGDALGKGIKNFRKAIAPKKEEEEESKEEEKQKKETLALPPHDPNKSTLNMKQNDKQESQS